MGLISLEMRRDRGDMIETFKTLRGINRIDSKRYFSIRTELITRGHKLKLSKCRSKLEIRKHFLAKE